MSYTITPFDDGHILLFTMHNDFEPAIDMPKYLPECYQFLEDGPDHVIVITDTTRAPMRDMDDLIQGANSVRNSLAQQINNHPKLLKSITVINNRIVQVAMKGLNTATFGFVDVVIATTVEEALDRARAVLAEQSQSI